MPACLLCVCVQDGDITEKNVTVAVVGKELNFTLLEGEALAPYIAGKKRALGRQLESAAMEVT